MVHKPISVAPECSQRLTLSHAGSAPRLTSDEKRSGKHVPTGVEGTALAAIEPTLDALLVEVAQAWQASKLVASFKLFEADAALLRDCSANQVRVSDTPRSD